MTQDINSLLSVFRLSVSFTRPTPLLALSEIDFSVPKNSIIGIVGESGSARLKGAIFRLTAQRRKIGYRPG